MQAGACDKTINTLLNGDGISGRLNKADIILWSVGISPHGKWGPIFHNHLLGVRRRDDYKFPPSCPEAEKMYHRSMAYPAPIGIIPLAISTWKKEKSKQQYFYGHSYTCPTPQEFSFQGMGLAFSNAIALKASQGISSSSPLQI